MSARGWAYAGVALGFTASITANVASTVLKETAVPLGLRVPFSIIWPVLTYVAIEVITRVQWSQIWSDWIVRVLLWGPVGFVAAFVSYLHQHHLMVLAGEPGLAQGLGPLAVDGLLFGCAVVLIKLRSTPRGDLSVDEALEKWMTTEDQYIPPAPITSSLEVAEAISTGDTERLEEWAKESAPVSAPPRRPGSLISREEASAISAGYPARRSSWDARKVAEMILDGAKTPEITEKTGAKSASIGRFRKVIRLLREDNRVTIDPAKEKVTSDNIRMMRELVTAR